MKYIVYKVTNLLNGKIYIGITQNELTQRRSEHYRDARYRQQFNDNPKFHKALLKYKEEDFIWEVLDDTAKSKNELYQKEIDYIKFYNSYINGYNSTSGGDAPPSTYGENNIQARLTDEQANEIKRLLKETVLYEQEIANMFNVDVTTIERIQSGKIRFDPTIDYPIRKFSKYEQIALNIIKDLQTTTLTCKQIADKYGVGADIPSRINTGKRYRKLYNGEYPIRKRK